MPKLMQNVFNRQSIALQFLHIHLMLLTFVLRVALATLCGCGFNAVPFEGSATSTAKIGYACGVRLSSLLLTWFCSATIANAFALQHVHCLLAWPWAFSLRNRYTYRCRYPRLRSNQSTCPKQLHVPSSIEAIWDNHACKNTGVLQAFRLEDQIHRHYTIGKENHHMHSSSKLDQRLV